MAKINRKTGTMSGKLGNEVYRDVGGIQTVGSMPKGFVSHNSRIAVEARAIASELGGMWRALPKEIRDLWKEYADTLGTASDVEANETVSYMTCPIPSYPPRPKKVSSYHAFMGAAATGIHCGFGIRLYPPLDVRVPPAPMIDCRYDRALGELVVLMDTPAIAKPKKRAVYKAILWLTAYRCVKKKVLYIASKRKFDLFDIAPIAQRIEKRYGGIEETQKGFDYKPLKFAQLPRIRIYIGAQVVMVPNELTAPIESSGNWVDYWILNESRYTQLEGLAQADYGKGVDITKDANAEYQARLEAKRAKLAKKKFIKVS